MSPASTRREHLAQRGKMIGMRKQHSAYPQSDSGRAGGIPAPRAGANGPTMYGRALLRVRAFRAEVGVREGGYSKWVRLPGAVLLSSRADLPAPSTG